jgi:hypothetical protein
LRSDNENRKLSLSFRSLCAIQFVIENCFGFLHVVNGTSMGLQAAALLRLQSRFYEIGKFSLQIFLSPSFMHKIFKQSEMHVHA